MKFKNPMLAFSFLGFACAKILQHTVGPAAPVQFLLGVSCGCIPVGLLLSRFGRPKIKERLFSGVLAPKKR